MSDLKEFLYRIQPTRPEMLTEGPTPEEADVVGRHFSYLKNLCDAGTVVLAGRTLNTDADTFGIVILRAASDDAARKIMADDPAVKEGVMSARIFPYRIAMMNRSPDE